MKHILILFFLFFISFTSHAQENAPLKQVGTPLPKARIYLVDEFGKLSILPGGKKVSFEWSPQIKNEAPSFKINFKFLEGWAAHPLPLDKNNTLTDLELNVNKKTTIKQYYIKKPNESPRLYSLVFELIFSDSLNFIHSSCPKLGVHLEQTKDTYPFLLLAARCSDQLYDSVTELEVFYLGEETIFKNTSLSKNFKVNEELKKITFLLPKSSHSGKIVFQNKETNNENEFKITSTGITGVLVSSEMGGSSSSRRFNFTLGSSITQMNYTQKPVGIDLNQISLTVKAGTTYSIINNKFNFGLSGFLNALNISYSYNDKFKNEKSVKFYGVNSRFAYTLPWSNENSRYTAQLGWYFWGMSVTSKRFGVQSLITGPQVLLTGMWNVFNTRKLYTYLKYAVIGDRTISLGNYEIAIGGGFLLNKKQAQHPLYLSFDISEASFKSATLAAAFKLNTYSLGISTSF